MIGKDGWLFHRPSFDLLTKKPEKSSDTFSGPHASINAIAALSTALNERGIKLVIMPTWPKTSTQPEQLGAIRSHNSLPVKPAWFASWSKEIEKTGAHLHDPADSIREAKATQNSIAYLRTDSHWNPVTMMNCARNLADDLVAKNWITPGTRKSLTVARKITNEGDLARMLRLPAGWQNLTKEETTISEVRTQSKERWLPNRQSPLLLLGDSYSNIFSLKSMGWGEDAGFSEHLGANLGFPIDCILRNGDGAQATRAELSAELARGKDRLAGKKLVIWQFSATELTAGNWKPMTYQVGQHANSDEFLEIDAGEIRKITATITSMGPVPHPTSTVYKDYVGYFELDEITEKSAPNSKTTKIFCFGLVIKDHQWTKLAGLRPGQKIKVTLGSWADAENEFGRHQRAEPDGELALEPPNWIRQVEPTTEP
jgi:alginate O-acetyltransferase complex protein AlgJ